MFNKIKYYLKILLWKSSTIRLQYLEMPKSFHISNHKYSIGIVTYVDRYDNYFKDLVISLLKLYNDTEIIIAINGYYNVEKQDRYLIEISKFLGQFQNIKVLKHKNPESLSKLWNKIIIKSSNVRILILNDDLKINHRLRRDIEVSKIYDSKIALINNSWSHFIISKEIVREVGYFDERFPGVGNEDEDYECRLVFKDISIKSFFIPSIFNVIHVTKDFSYGDKIETINTKYVKVNKQFFDEKWEISNVQKPGFKYVRILRQYVKLKNGMETPEFYN